MSFNFTLMQAETIYKFIVGRKYELMKRWLVGNSGSRGSRGRPGHSLRPLHAPPRAGS